MVSRVLKDPLTKPWLLFLSNVLPVFEKFNVFFQTSSAATIHKVLGESERLLKTVLSFFIDTNIIRINSYDLTKIDYTNSSNHIPDDQVFIGDDTTALVLHLKDNEGESVQNLFRGVVKFYEFFVKKQLKLFDFMSQLLSALAFLDPEKSVEYANFTVLLDLLSSNIVNLCVMVKFVMKRTVMLPLFG